METKITRFVRIKCNKNDFLHRATKELQKPKIEPKLLIHFIPSNGITFTLADGTKQFHEWLNRFNWIERIGITKEQEGQ